MEEAREACAPACRLVDQPAIKGPSASGGDQRENSPLRPPLGRAEFRAGGSLRAYRELADEQPPEPEIFLVT